MDFGVYSRLKILYRLCIITLLLTGTSFGGQKDTPPSIFSISDTWTDQNGNKVLLNKNKGKVTILSMVYLSCDYSCPIITQKHKLIYKNLSPGLKKSVKFVLMTFDPDRDTTVKLKEFSKKHSLDESSFSLLSSSPKQTHKFSLIIGFQYKKVGDNDFSHSNSIYVIDQDGVIKEKFEVSDKAKTIVESIEKIAK